MWSKLIDLTDVLFPSDIAADPKDHSLARHFQGVARMLFTGMVVMLFTVFRCVCGAPKSL